VEDFATELLKAGYRLTRWALGYRGRVREWRRIAPGEAIELTPAGGVIAFDGEKEHELGRAARVAVTLSLEGPRIVEIRRTLDLAARAGLFVRR